MLGLSTHTDTFCRDNLPPADSQPVYLLDRFAYPETLNAAVELTDRLVERGFGDRVALVGQGRSRTYAELADWTSRIARTLVEDYGIWPGNRILISKHARSCCLLAGRDKGRGGRGEHHATAAEEGTAAAYRKGANHPRALRHADAR
jgi:hypothetical protein